MLQILHAVFGKLYHYTTVRVETASVYKFERHFRNMHVQFIKKFRVLFYRTDLDIVRNIGLSNFSGFIHFRGEINNSLQVR